MSAADAVLAALVGPLSALGVDVEEVQVQRAGRRHVVRVVIDRDGGVDLDRVAEVSQAASALLDAPPLSDEVPGPFVLEVTSPGVDRPLTQPRHWRRALGRLVDVHGHDGTAVVGRVLSAPDDDDASPAVLLRTDGGEQEVALAGIARAVVQVEFNRGDQSGAEVLVGEDAPDEDEEE
jgi:ribosome maturation factor RimP